MKLRAYWPVLLAVAVIVVLYLVRSTDDDSERAAPRDVPVHARSNPAPAPALPAPAAGSGSVEVAPHKPPLPAGAEPMKPPDPKPEMTLAEKLVETKKHVDVMERRATILEQEIAELERAGKQQQAAEQRVVLQRLRAHANELRAAIAEKREPL